MRILYHPRSKYLWNECTSDMIGLYSFRKIIKNYNGACINVARSSDGTYQDIGFVNNLLDIDTLMSFVGSSDGHIRYWYDQSGLCTAHPLFQTLYAYGRCPQIVIGGSLCTEDGKPCAFFGYRHNLYTYQLGIDFSSNISIFVVAKLTSDSGYVSPLLQTASKYSFLGATVDNKVASYFGDGSTWGYETANSDQSWLNNRLLVTSINNGYDNQFINGNAITPRNNPMSAHTSSLGVSYIPIYYTDRNNSWHGNIQELIVYNADKSANRFYIENNINNYYGIY